MRIANAAPLQPDQPEGQDPLTIQLAAEQAGRPPFLPLDRFIPTAFSRRLLAMFEHAMATGVWHLIAALSGDGKSTTLDWFRAQHPPVVVEEPDGHRVRKVAVLATRVSRGLQSADRLMVALANGLGAVPSLRAYQMREWLVEAIRRADVRLIVIDDAHELSMAQLSYLRELLDQLAGRGCRPALVLLAACATPDPRAGEPWRMIARNDLVAEQFRRRLNGPDPIVFIEGLSLPELGRVLATWEVLYRPCFPDLELAKWTTSLHAWLTDPRNDVGRTRRVRMRYLAETVSAALAVAWAEGRTGLRSDGMDLYNAALRITVRGLTYAILAADPRSESPSSAP